MNRQILAVKWICLAGAAYFFVAAYNCSNTALLFCAALAYLAGTFSALAKRHPDPAPQSITPP